MEWNNNSEINFTSNAHNFFIKTSESFSSCDEASTVTIRCAIHKMLQPVPFCDYLKRYLYQRANLTKPFSQISNKTYRNIIIGSFAENNTGSTFSTSTSTLSAIASNWLRQFSVRRSVVFLLGFGLDMSVDDVDMFLTKALREQKININDPFEAICLYCYTNKFKFAKAKKLLELYDTLKPVETKRFSNIEKQKERILSNEKKFIEYLSYLSSKASIENKIALDTLNELYDSFRKCIYEENKDVYHCFEEISTVDVELKLYGNDSVNNHGNLYSAKLSGLKKQFCSKKFTRQRISSLFAQKSTVDRFDIITLNFGIYSYKAFSSNNKRLEEFSASTNQLLEKCGFSELYYPNPYECFVMLCLLSDDPLMVYADVWQAADIDPEE